MFETLYSFSLSITDGRVCALSQPLQRLFADGMPETPQQLFSEACDSDFSVGDTLKLKIEGEPIVKVVHTQQQAEARILYLVPLVKDLAKLEAAGLTAVDLLESDPLRDYWSEVSRLVAEVDRRSTGLHHAERMASLGTLAAGVAHEINNPLAYIKSNLMSLEGFLQPMVSTVESLLEIEKESPQTIDDLKALGLEYDSQELGFILEDLDDLLKDLRDGSERIVTIVSGLKQFSHPTHHQKELTDLNEAVRVAIELSRNEYKYHVELTTHLEPLPKIRANTSEITQVLVNLIVNAAQAIHDTGKIDIETQVVGSNIEISVQDSGSGIPQDVLSKIFNPFYTTKEIGKGTGLGLSISHRIVKEHGGTITATSKAGEMTRFVMQFPIEQS